MTPTITDADRALLDLIYGGAFKWKPARERMVLQAFARHREAAVAAVIRWLETHEFGADIFDAASPILAEMIEKGAHLKDQDNAQA